MNKIYACLLIVFSINRFSFATEHWFVSIPKLYKNETVIQTCLDDLKTTGQEYGLVITWGTNVPSHASHIIAVGNAKLNPYTFYKTKHDSLSLSNIDHEQGFEIKTIHENNAKRIFVSGGSLIGDVYGLYWIWDRLCVYRKIPDIDVVRIPKLEIRFAGGETEDAIRHALRYTSNWVSGGNILNLTPWNSEPEKNENAKHRQNICELIDYAHSLHMKFLSTCDEITYHPSLLQKYGAKRSPDNPNLWSALQEKYRMLLKDLPELDGVRIRTGELTRVFGDYEGYDVMHDRAESGWSLEKTYRTFVQKLYEVVVGEFDKIYYHRTWVTNTTEQHSQPSVYQKIFTQEIPVKNLYLSPYLSTADRWLYQPYNPTFNLTPHNMVVLLATLDYHAVHGVDVFPIFPGPYYQRGLQKILEPKDSNVIGSNFAIPSNSTWDTLNLTAYTAFRLSWDPDEDLRDIAHDFASIHFGQTAAESMAEILLLSYQAYKDGMYVKPVAESVSGNTLPQLRLTTFPVQGFPELDHSKAHIEWLRETFYQPCKVKMKEAKDYLDRGLSTAKKMCSLFQESKPLIEDGMLVRKVEQALDLTRLLIKTNNLYIKTMFAYFDYRADPSSERKTELAKISSILQKTKKEFLAAPGCVYRTFGIDRLLHAVDDVLLDRENAEERLERTLNTAALLEAIQKKQEINREIFEKHANDAVHFLHWEGFVDGKDILLIRGDHVEIQHIQNDPPQHVQYNLIQPLPQKEVTVLLNDLESRPIHPFVLQQPSKENDYTAKIYLFDSPGGSGWIKLDLLFLASSPE